MFCLSGWTNYAWSAAIWLGFLCLYRSLWAGTSRIRDTPFSWFWIGVTAFAAGMTNENQIPASLGMLFVYWFYARSRGMVLPRWFFIGWGFHALGGAFLLLAPGNAARLHSETAGGAAVLHSWGERFGAITELVNAFYEFMPMAARCRRRSDPADCESGDENLAGGGRAAHVRLPAVYSGGSCHGNQLFCTCDSGMARHVFRYGVDDDGHSGVVRSMDGGCAKALDSILRAAGGGPALWVCSGYLDAFPRIHRQCEERNMFIRRELEQGKKNITVPPYDSVPLAPYVSVMWRMSSGDPDEFINRSMARYLGIESIRVAVPEP